jgi:hypothetical protein
MRLRDRHCRVTAIHDVASAAAVNMKIHESGYHNGLRAIANDLFGNRNAHDRLNVTCVKLNASAQKSLRRQDVAFKVRHVLFLSSTLAHSHAISTLAIHFVIAATTQIQTDAFRVVE